MLTSRLVPPRTDVLVLGSAMLGNLLAGLAARIFQVSLPTMADALATDIIGISWALISHQLATTSLGLVFGRLSDIYGRQRLYVVGLGLMTLGAFLSGTATSLGALIGFRILQGAGAALTQACARALAMDALPRGTEGKASAFTFVSFQTGFVIGPPLGALAVEFMGWRWIFFALVPVGLAGVALALLGLHRAPGRAASTRRAGLDLPGAAMFVTFVVLLAVLLEPRASRALFGPYRLPATLGLVALGVAFLTHESRTKSPMLDLALFRNRLFSFSVGSLFCTAVTFAIMGLLMPFYLQHVLRLPAAGIAGIFLVSPLLTMALSPLAGGLSDRHGPRAVAAWGVGFTVLAYVIGSGLATDSHWVHPLLVVALTGLGLAFFTAPNHAAIIGSVHDRERGVAAGMIQTMFGLAHFVGVAAGGALLTAVFQSHPGMLGERPDALAHPLVFVAAADRVYLLCVAVGAVSMACSLLCGGAKVSHMPGAAARQA